MEPAVPIHFCIVEAEDTITLSDFDIEIVWSGKHFVRERSIFILLAYIVNFVNDGLDVAIFVT